VKLAERQNLSKEISESLKSQIIEVKKQLTTTYAAQLLSLVSKIESEEANKLTDLSEEFCHITRLLARDAHKLKMQIDWGIPQSPEWMNHYQDYYFQLPDTKVTFFLERGIFARLAFTDRLGTVLELCCGDGFNTKYFYSPYCSKIIALGLDEKAIAHAKQYNSDSKIEYSLADIRSEIPPGQFDTVIWDAAIEHFTDSETEIIIDTIKNRLAQNGILAGYTLVEAAGGKSLHQHEREFKSKEDLFSFLKLYFLHVVVIETKPVERHNLYFFASDYQHIPFQGEWSSWFHKGKA
jgi:SAM-dependent methyltransferase